MDLGTTYMGLPLKNPVIPSSSPFTEKLEHLKELEDHGAPAVVLCSIFEEQVRHETEEMEGLLGKGAESFAEALTYFPSLGAYRTGTDDYLDLIARAKEALDIPVIASLNGCTPGGWVSFAERMAQAGADGMEINLYHVAADPNVNGAGVEKQYLEVVRAIRQAVSIPLAVKLSPFFSSIAHMAAEFARCGANALVLFNRFYQPDLDIETLTAQSTLRLSNPEEIRLPLRWIGLLKECVPVSLAGSTGVDSATEIIKYLMAGADAAMTASALMKKGIPHLRAMLDELTRWMERHEYASVSEMKGLFARRETESLAVFERANYIKILEKGKEHPMM